MSSDTSVALGLTEFVAKLIEETFNAISLSAQEQAERSAKFNAAIKLSLDEFINKYVSDFEIDLKLEELFPSETDKSPHCIYIGAPYTPAESSQEEKPPVFNNLGLELSTEDYSSGKLTPKGVVKIREATKMMTGQSLYESFRKMVGRGIPRVVVDNGRILTKLTFETLELDTTKAANSSNADTPTVKTASVTKTPRLMFSKTPSNILSISTVNLQRISNIRLAVAPVTKNDQPSDAKSSVYGEVEIHFRTVSD